jgi:hypothetical protein
MSPDTEWRTDVPPAGVCAPQASHLTDAWWGSDFEDQHQRGCTSAQPAQMKRTQ